MAETEKAHVPNPTAGDETGTFTEAEKRTRTEVVAEQGSHPSPSSSTVASGVLSQEGEPQNVEAARTEPTEPEPYPPPVNVPRTRRRGILASVTLLPEVENPYHYTNKQKWTITAIIALCALGGPFASGIILPALTPITNEFKTSSLVANLSVSCYMIALGIFPLWWSAFSEQFGRRSIYIISYAFFVVFAILSAVSQSIGMFIAMRLLNGGASAAVQAVGAGTLADIWEPRERGRAMGYFYLGPLCGPLLAPIIGGGLSIGLGWRSTMWCLAIYGVVIWALIIFALPETLSTKNRPSEIAAARAKQSESLQPTLTRVSTAQSVKIKSKQYMTWFRFVIINPLAVIGYLRFPPVALTVYFASVVFGALYFFQISLEYTFSRPPYNFATWLVGFTYIPGSLGYCVGSIYGGPWMDRIMKREAIKAKRYDEAGHLVYLPEDRMGENAYLGAILIPVALLWYGWAAQEHVMWVGVLIAPFFSGIGIMLIFSLVTTMLTEFMPGRSSAGVAVNNLCRNFFSFAGSLAASPIIAAIGNGWLMTIVAVWAICSASAILLIKYNGPKWRKEMNEKMK